VGQDYKLPFYLKKKFLLTFLIGSLPSFVQGLGVLWSMCEDEETGRKINKIFGHS
jgi:hypothetical protein